jgi:erythromycin esterase-like protein
MSTIRTPDLQRGATGADDAEDAIEAVRKRATPLTTDTVDDLAARVAEATYVLLGESSHGTAEFYRWRARLTARLVEDYGFDVVAVEGDWTDCYEVNRYVRGETSPTGGALDVLDAFDRWPTWLWANWETVEFVDWLRGIDDARPAGERVGFYGMDVYSLFESMAAVVDYLEDVDPEAAARARDAYTCFEPYSEDGQSYARDLRMAPEDCEDEVVDVLRQLSDDVQAGEIREDSFAAEQNALVAKNAEAYYRSMIQADVESWNVRDEHMVETLERLRSHHGPDSKVIVWAHNTHVGDARATDMTRRGEVNVGQLIREQVGPDEAAIVGFGTERGSVVASDAWGEPAREMSVPPAKAGSYESVFHRAGVGDAILTFDRDEEGPLTEPRGHRAIGVVYHPRRELGNYVPTVLPDRYDAYVHVDETTALHPLHAEPEADDREPPETYPWGV